LGILIPCANPKIIAGINIRIACGIRGINTRETVYIKNENKRRRSWLNLRESFPSCAAVIAVVMEEEERIIPIKNDLDPKLSSSLIGK